jgi:membrane-bound serine protease (ClpP class)
MVGRSKRGGRTRTRTRDLRFWRPPLYRLSYTPPAPSGILSRRSASAKPRGRGVVRWSQGSGGGACYPDGVMVDRTRRFAMVALAIVLGFAALSPAWAQAGAVWLIPIDTEITPATAQFVRSRVERANRERPLALVFYVDTPGGQVPAMQRIVAEILNGAQVPTIAVVRNAFSAGALIAMAAERVAMLPGSAIGAATPIAITPLGVAPVDEKVNSALRGEFRSVAEARGRDPRIAEGMVDARIEVPGIAGDQELITLTAAQAVTFGIADVEARTLNEALEAFGYGGVPVVRLERNLTERIGTLLANPFVVAILLVLGIGGLALEFFSPGFGIPGAVGLLALAALALTAVVATPAGPFDLALIVLGVVLLAVEALIIPGFGVAGILGIGVLGFAVFRIFQESWLTVLGSSTVLGGVLLAILLWFLPHARLAGRLRLSTRLGHAPDAAPATPGVDRWVGGVGVAATDLRPAGIATLGGERVDVVTQGDFIAAGSAIEVVRVDGSRITVRLVHPPAIGSTDSLVS